jgi:protein SCO1/2
MKIFPLIVALLVLVSTSVCAVTDAELHRVEIEQRLGATLPLNLVFRDETNAPVRLGSYFGERPVVLALVYYGCPNLCTVTLNGLVESVRVLTLQTGRDFDIVVVSIDPSETAALAATKKHTYTMRYGRPGGAAGWHFLTGSQGAIQPLAEAVGFHYIYDPATKQFAHAAGFAVAAPDGKISRYFLGIEYPPRELRQALVDASAHRVGTLTERLLLLCFHYNPINGHYGALITRIVQITGLATAAGVAALLFTLHRRARRNAPAAP